MDNLLQEIMRGYCSTISRRLLQYSPEEDIRYTNELKCIITQFISFRTIWKLDEMLREVNYISHIASNLGDIYIVKILVHFTPLVGLTTRGNIHNNLIKIK